VIPFISATGPPWTHVSQNAASATLATAQTATGNHESCASDRGIPSHAQSLSSCARPLIFCEGQLRTGESARKLSDSSTVVNRRSNWRMLNPECCARYCTRTQPFIAIISRITESVSQYFRVVGGLALKNLFAMCTRCSNESASPSI